MDHQLSTDARQKGHPTNLINRLQDFVNILDEVLHVARRANRLQSMFETDDHTIATVTESILLHVRSGLFQAIAKGWSKMDDVITTSKYLPALEIVFEVVIHDHSTTKS